MVTSKVRYETSIIIYYIFLSCLIFPFFFLFIFSAEMGFHEHLLPPRSELSGR